MRAVWSWFRRRAWWAKGLIALAVLPVVAAALYVAVRSLQYAAAEKDAGVFAPQKAQIVVRARDLEGHWARIQKSKAWLVLKRKILREPAVRRPLNGALKEAGLPTLDDLEDVRKASLYSEENLFLVAGRDTMAALQVGDKWDSARWCAGTRLRWREFLLTPFAGLVLGSEPVAGRSAFKVRQGRMDVFLVLEGALVLASNDRALLEDALRRKGAAAAPDRPIEGRIEFRGSRALADLRTTIAKTGLAPHVRIESARGVEFSIDAAGKSGEAIALDLLVTGTEAAYPTTPPHAFSGFAPSGASGALLTQVGVQDLYAWLQSLIDRSGKAGYVSENAAQAVEQLEKAGFTKNFLPRVDRGMALVTGIEDRGGRSWPTFALLVAASDGKAATEALSQVVKAIAGKMAEAKFREYPVLDTTMYTWEWPKGLGVDNFLTPCFAALEGGFVFGNNLAFTESVIQASRGGDRFKGERLWRDLQAKLKAYGFASEPGAAGGWAFVPRIRESLDGLLPKLAEQVFSASMTEREVGNALDKELNEQGRRVTNEERTRLFLEYRRQLVANQEEELRRALRILDPLTWAFFESQATPKGVTYRIAVELR
jgi:hypothetical protein